MNKNVIYLLLLLLTTQIFSDNQTIWNKNIDWESNKIEIEIKTPLQIKDSTLSSERMRAENWIEDNLTIIFFKNILNIQVDSLMNVSEIINKDPDIYYLLDALGESITPEYNRLSTNLEYLDSKYSFPIYPDFISVFYKNSQHTKLIKKLDHRIYPDFTGLIIYVPEELPLYKKGENGSLKKVLFPQIYDEDMNLILDYTMVEPDYIKKWGMVMYGSTFNESVYQSRIGISPLRIIAKGLFGKNNSNIIISVKEAEKLTGSIENLKIISQSRILILN